MNKGKAVGQSWKGLCLDLGTGDYPLLSLLSLKEWKAKGNSLRDFQRSDTRAGEPILWSETLKCFVEAREETLHRKRLPAKHRMTKQEVLALAKMFSDEKPMKAQPGSEAHRALQDDARNLVHEAQALLQTAPVSAETIARDSMSHSRMAQKLLVQSFASIGLSQKQDAKVMTPENHQLIAWWSSEASSNTTHCHIRRAAGRVAVDLCMKLAEEPCG